jgi:putative sterol carrier protein
VTDELLELMRERIAIGLKREETLDAIEGWERTALLLLKEGKEYHFIVKNNKILVNTGGIEHPDIKIESDEDTIRKLFLEEMSARSALLRKKIKVKGSIPDFMKFGHIF